MAHAGPLRPASRATTFLHAPAEALRSSVWPALGLVATSCLALVAAARAFIHWAYVSPSPFVAELMPNRAAWPIGHYLDRATLIAIGLHVLFLLAVLLYHAAPARSALLCLGILLAGDVVYGVLSETQGGVFDVRKDRSLPEIYQYGKELAIAWLLYRLFAASRQPIFAVLSGLFAFFLLDDALRYHEAVGLWLSTHLPLAGLAARLGARANDVGEVLSLALPLAALGLSVVPAYWRSRPDARRQARRVAYLVVLLAASGVVLDFVVPIVGSVSLGFVEDWSEMAVMSATAAFCASLFWRQAPSPPTFSRA
jgi:hypothetical protein